jgi:uncharacterized protein YqgC (DUF456 family)
MPCGDFVRYHAVVLPILPSARLILWLGIIVYAAEAAHAAQAAGANAPQSFYTVTAEMALARHEPRLAAQQYAAGAQRDASLLPPRPCSHR